MIKFDETELMDVFDSVNIADAQYTDIGGYSFKYTREDGVVISLGFNKYDSTVNLSVHQGKIVSPYISHLKNCKAIRVLDTKRKQFEILVDGEPSLRCFIDLLGEIIIAIEHID